MKRKHGGVFLAALLGVAAVCVVATFVPRLMNFLPFWHSCCHALDMLLRPDSMSWLPSAARLLLVALSVITFAAVLRGVWHTRRLIAKLNATTVPPSGRVGQAVQALGLAGQVTVLDTPVPLAFCFGLLKPRICLSTGLAELLTDGELQAVLLHEDYHRQRYEPLRTLLVQLLTTIFFFLPVVAEWRDYFLTSAELAADRYAIRLAGKPLLAGALHKFLSYDPAGTPAPGAGVSGFSATKARVAHLLDGYAPTPHFSTSCLAVSTVGVFLACIMLQLALG